VTVGEMIGLDMEPEDEAVTWERIRTSGLRRRMACLARNLRDAAGCALAWRLRRDFGNSWERGDCDAWCPNLEGKPAPGWER